MKYFNINEFDSPDLKGSGSNMSTYVLEALDVARMAARVPFIINSGFRTKEHNLKVGGIPTSSHLNGTAVDIRCDNGSDRQKIVYGLTIAGFHRIGIAKTFIHADMDSKPSALWLY